MLTVAESGERKTAADALAGVEVHERRKLLQTKYKRDVRVHEAALEAHKMRARKAKEAAEDADGLARTLGGLRSYGHLASRSTWYRSRPRRGYF